MQTATNAVIVTANKYKLLARTRSDGYLYLGDDFKLYFCDHSGDNRDGNPAGPDHCEDTPCPLSIKSLMSSGDKVIYEAVCVKREDGCTVLLAIDIYKQACNYTRLLHLR